MDLHIKVYFFVIFKIRFILRMYPTCKNQLMYNCFFVDIFIYPRKHEIFGRTGQTEKLNSISYDYTVFCKFTELYSIEYYC